MVEHPKEMRCIECGDWHILRTDEYEFLDAHNFKMAKINGVPYYKCSHCGDILLTPEMCEAIEKKLKEDK